MTLYSYKSCESIEVQGHSNLFGQLAYLACGCPSFDPNLQHPDAVWMDASGMLLKHLAKTETKNRRSTQKTSRKKMKQVCIIRKTAKHTNFDRRRNLWIETHRMAWPPQRNGHTLCCSAACQVWSRTSRPSLTTINHISVTYQSLSVTISHRQYAHLWKLMVSSITSFFSHGIGD